MKHKMPTLFSVLSVLVLGGCLSWVCFFPSVSVFGSKAKISLFDLAKINEETTDYGLNYYKKRLTSGLYNDCYLLDEYYFFIACIDNKKVRDIEKENKHILEKLRTTPCIISGDDHAIIRKLKNQLREVVMDFYASGKPVRYPGNFNEKMMIVFVGFYFRMYHDYLQYGKEFNQDELIMFAQWLESQIGTDGVHTLLRDPLGWGEKDFEKLREKGYLRQFVQHATCTELLLDRSLYEKESSQFLDMILKNTNE